MTDGVCDHSTDRVIGAGNTTRTDTEKTQILRLPDGKRITQHQRNSENGKKYPHLVPCVSQIGNSLFK